MIDRKGDTIRFALESLEQSDIRAWVALDAYETGEAAAVLSSALVKVLELDLHYQEDGPSGVPRVDEVRRCLELARQISDIYGAAFPKRPQ